MKKRNNVVDIMKGIGILLVILGHTLSMNSRLHAFIYAFHMPLFYMLSGYFLKPLKKSGGGYYKQYIYKRFNSLIKPYIIGGIIIIVLSSIVTYYFTGSFFNSLNSIIYWLKAVLYGSGGYTLFNFPIVGIGYYLLALFFADIIVKYIISNFKKEYQIIFILLITLTGYYLSLYGYHIPFSIPIGLFNCLFVYVGYCLSQSTDLENITKDTCTTIICVLFSFLITFVFATKCGNTLSTANIYPGNYFAIIASFTGSYIVYVISKMISKAKLCKLFEFIGKNTILIFIIHWVELDVIPWQYIIDKYIIYFKMPDYIFAIILRCFLITVIFNIIYYIKKLNSIK